MPPKVAQTESARKRKAATTAVETVNTRLQGEMDAARVAPPALVEGAQASGIANSVVGVVAAVQDGQAGTGLPAPVQAAGGAASGAGTAGAGEGAAARETPAQGQQQPAMRKRAPVVAQVPCGWRGCKTAVAARPSPHQRCASCTEEEAEFAKGADLESGWCQQQPDSRWMANCAGCGKDDTEVALCNTCPMVFCGETCIEKGALVLYTEGDNPRPKALFCADCKDRGRDSQVRVLHCFVHAGSQ